MSMRLGRWSGLVLSAGVVVVLAGGCGGFTIVVPDVPTDCFQEDVVGEECFTEITTIEVCDEICDFFGCYEDCYLEDVVDVYCQDVIVDSYIICD